MFQLKGNRAILQKVIMDKGRQFDNLTMYSMTGDVKYLYRMEGFYRLIGEIGNVFNCESLTGVLDEFKSYAIDGKDGGASNILSLYGKVYTIIERLWKQLEGADCRSNKGYGWGKLSQVRDDHILVVHDGDIVLKDIELVMDQGGYSSVLYAKSKNIMDILKKEDIALIILDISLLNTDKFCLVELIREAYPIMPIIIVSDRDKLEVKIAMLEAGADAYVIKPFNNKEFYAIIDRALSRRRDYDILSIKDSLTGAYTKEYLWKRAYEKEVFYSEDGVVFSIAFIDMDDFKDINNSYGHLIGDQILKCFVRVLGDTLRSTDLIFRYGGDEFIVIFPGATEDDAKLILNRFNYQTHCDQCDNTECITLANIHFSAGITQIKGNNDTIQDMIRRADRALHKAKISGGDITIVYKD